MTQEPIGFIGLGNTGMPMADHIAGADFDIMVHDIAGTTSNSFYAERAPQDAGGGGSVAEVAQQSSAIFLSLPTPGAVTAVANEIAGSGAGTDRIVVNTSTVDPETTVAAHDRLAAQGIRYVDAPISGGVMRAREGTLTVIYSGDDASFIRLKPAFKAISEHIFRVSDVPGHAQRMKLFNNYIAGCTMVANSEALAYGAASGLDMKTMLEMINVSSGQNFMFTNWFSRCLLPEEYESWSAAEIIAKDVSLFVKSAATEGRSHHVAQATHVVLGAFSAEDPKRDQMYLYEYVRDGKFSATD